MSYANNVVLEWHKIGLMPVRYKGSIYSFHIVLFIRIKSEFDSGSTRLLCSHVSQTRVEPGLTTQARPFSAVGLNQVTEVQK